MIERLRSLSILIVTQSRTVLLERAIESLRIAAASIPSLHFEFLVVINGHDPKTKELMAKRYSGFTLIELTENNPGSARNAAVRVATGDWIYFADDDITVAPDFFDKFKRLHDLHPQLDVLGGPNLTPLESSDFQIASGLALASPLASFRCADRYRSGATTLDCDDSKLILCNLFVRRTTAIGAPFPKTFLCAEENFALSRWKGAGARFLYSSDLGVRHERRKNAYSFFKQVVKYGRGRGRLVAIGDFNWFHAAPSFALVMFLVTIALDLTELASTSIAFLLVSFYVAVVSAAAVLAREKNSLRQIARIAFSIISIHLGYAVGVILGATLDHRNPASLAETREFAVSPRKIQNY